MAAALLNFLCRLSQAIYCFYSDESKANSYSCKGRLMHRGFSMTESCRHFLIATTNLCRPYLNFSISTLFHSRCPLQVCLIFHYFSTILSLLHVSVFKKNVAPSFETLVHCLQGLHQKDIRSAEYIEHTALQNAFAFRNIIVEMI